MEYIIPIGVFIFIVWAFRRFKFTITKYWYKKLAGNISDWELKMLQFFKYSRYPLRIQIRKNYKDAKRFCKNCFNSSKTVVKTVSKKDVQKIVCNSTFEKNVSPPPYRLTNIGFGLRDNDGILKGLTVSVTDEQPETFTECGKSVKTDVQLNEGT